MTRNSRLSLLIIALEVSLSPLSKEKKNQFESMEEEEIL